MRFVKVATLVTVIVAMSALALSGCSKHTEHIWGEWEVVKPANCDTNGYSIRTCIECGEQDRSIQYATPHQYSDNYSFDSSHHWREAICQHAGEIIGREAHKYEDNTCTICGAIKGTTVSQGLQYRGILGTRNYRVIGIGTTLDQNIVIARYYNSCEIISVGERAFAGNPNLLSVTMQKYITEIEDGAFADNPDLVFIRFTYCVQSLGSELLSGCDSFEYIRYEGTVEQWNAMTKANDWSAGLGVFEVRCSDGTLTVNAD